MELINPDPHMLLICSMVEDVKNRYMMARGKKPKRVFLSSDLFWSSDIPFEINGLDVYEHPAGGTFVFCGP